MFQVLNAALFIEPLIAQAAISSPQRKAAINILLFYAQKAHKKATFSLLSNDHIAEPFWGLYWFHL